MADEWEVVQADDGPVIRRKSHADRIGRKENTMDYATLTLRVRVVGPDAVGEDAVTEQEEDQIGTAFWNAEEAAKKALAGMRFEINADYD